MSMTGTKTKQVEIRYCAALREQRGTSCETITTSASTLCELYKELASKYNFGLSLEHIHVAVNNKFANWDNVINDQDNVIFMPPVAGG